jgi:hypothetical protein
VPPIHRPVETAERVRRLLGYGPHAVADVLALGITPGQLRAAVGAGTLRRPRRGVLSCPPGPAPTSHLAAARRDHREQALAALVSFGEGTVVSHESAGLLLGIPTRRPGALPEQVDVTAPGQSRRRRGVHVHAGVVDRADRALVDGVLCTSLARSALDLARRRPLAESLVVLDAAVRVADPGELRAAYDRLAGGPGMTALAGALALADPLSESPLESASRGVLLTAGLPAPELQAWVRGGDGRSYRVDFRWRAQRVVGEADGWGKYVDLDVLRAEKRREDALRDAGLTVVRWTSDELWRSPADVVRRVARALAA